MALFTKAIKGTQDVLPANAHKHQYIENTMLDIAGYFGFKEIRTPVFEHTELFTRSVGDTTDVVQKEMYTFEDKGGRSITLRPEGTAGAVRAFLEHGLFNEAFPQKVCYFTSCYRYEKPQAGRLREFHQFGVECFGTASPAADAEVISLADEIFAYIGVRDLRLEINSIGCPACRAVYHAALKDYFESKRDILCATCLERLERNPMRLLDCKSPVCAEIGADAPVMLKYLCDDCAAHFKAVKQYLEVMNIAFEVNARIVRGLDYYTRTVFEFVSSDIGAQGTVCGGGRYDGLVEQMGGPSVPSLGFALGLERLMLLLLAQGVPLPEAPVCELYIAPIGEAAGLKAAALAAELRACGIAAGFDVVGRSVKAQMKYADKTGARFTVVLGEDDLKRGDVTVRDMQNGETAVMKLDGFADAFMDFSVQRAARQLMDALED